MGTKPIGMSDEARKKLTRDRYFSWIPEFSVEGY